MNILKEYKEAYKKAIKENLDVLYDVKDGYPVSEDKFEKWMASKPDLSQMGILFDLRDNRMIHGFIFRMSDDMIFGSISEGGINTVVFDLPKDTSKYFNKFKSEIKKNFGESISNEENCRKQFEIYLSKNILKL